MLWYMNYLQNADEHLRISYPHVGMWRDQEKYQTDSTWSVHGTGPMSYPQWESKYREQRQLPRSPSRELTVSSALHLHSANSSPTELESKSDYCLLPHPNILKAVDRIHYIHTLLLLFSLSFHSFWRAGRSKQQIVLLWNYLFNFGCEV